MSDITQLQKDYVHAIASAQDESLSGDARDRATADAVRLRHDIDSTLIARTSDRESDEARAKAESIAYGMGSFSAATATSDGVVVGGLLDLASRKREGFTFELYPRETRTDVINVTNAGAYAGYTVPTSLSDAVWIYRRQMSAVRQVATILPTRSGEVLNLPTVTTDPVATWKGEDAQLDTIYPVFGEKTLTSWKLGGIVNVSAEVMRDSIIDMGSMIGKLLGRDIGTKEAVQFVQGDGTTEPGGVCIEASSGKTTAAAPSFTADELLDLKFSVAAPYRNSPSTAWLFGDAGLTNLSKLKDGEGNYLLRPSLVEGTPDTLFGQKLLNEVNMPAPTAGLTPVAYGDFSAFYIRDVGPLRIDASIDFRFDYDLVSLRVLHAVDSTLVDVNAVKLLTMHA